MDNINLSEQESKCVEMNEHCETPIEQHDEHELLHPNLISEEEDAHFSSLDTQGAKTLDHTKSNAHKEKYDSFLREIEEQTQVESKVQLAISFMEASLAQHGTPHFKSFWDARTICMELFKENINPALRSEFWAKYVELSKEARRLKEILDEQSAFASEQIEIAIQALENDLDNIQDILEKTADTVEFPFSKALEGEMGQYILLQHELGLLNTFASRINALRKELIKTDMRIKQKNKFFQRLSLAGDKVFPRRKELIKDVSQKFIEDVDAFVKEHLDHPDFHESLYFLREEIKALQGIAKLLTLNTHSFTQTRMRLSEGWDKIKVAEKEKKKIRTQQKEVSKVNTEELKGAFAELLAQFQENKLSTHEALKNVDELFNRMKTTELAKEDVRFLKDELFGIKKQVQEKINAEENERKAQDAQREQQKIQQLEDLKGKIQLLCAEAEGVEPEEIVVRRDELLVEINASPLSKGTKQELERQLKPLKDVLNEKKEKAILSLSDDDRQALQQLKNLLKERKERRQEVRDQVEAYRKAAGSSGLNFAQAMNYNDLMAAENERLDKLNHGIKEVEEKISSLEG